MFLNTPNECGAFFVILTLLLLGVFIYLKNRDNLSKSSCLYLVLDVVAVLVSLSILVLTYSRGAVLALLLAGLVFAFCVRRTRDKMVVSGVLAVFILIFLIVPAGAERILSINSQDDSIGNRLILWEGALEMTYNNWFSGVGFRNFGDVYIGWYQPANMFHEYTTAVNNLLTVSSSGGIFLFFLYMFLSLSPMVALISIYRKKGNEILLGLAFALLGYFLSGFSSAFIYSLWLNIAIISLMLVSFTLIIYYWHKEQISLKAILLEFRLPAAISALACVLVLIFGAYFNSEADFHYKRINNYDGNKISLNEVIPVRQKVRAVVLYSYNSDRTIIEKEARKTIRYLSGKGYIVLVPKLSSMDKNGLQELKSTYASVLLDKRYEKYPIILMGQSEGGQYTLISAAGVDSPRLKAVISIGAAAKWPFPEMSPDKFISKIKAPIYFLHGEEDTLNESENALLLAKASKSNNIKVEIIPKVADYLEPERFKTIDKIDLFIMKCLKK